MDVLRVATPADLTWCFELDARCFRPGIAFPQEAFTDLADSAEVFLVLERDGRAVGFVVAVLDDDDKLGVIVTLDVDPEFRRLGLGTALLTGAHRELARRGAEAVFLHVDPVNAGALRLYEKHRYAHVSRFRDYYGPRSDALLLMRNLGMGDP